MTPNKKSPKPAKKEPQEIPTPGDHIKKPRYKRDDYTIRQERFKEALEALEVETPRVDGFASPENSRCPLFWDARNSAFDRNWKAQGLLWLNPPFQFLPRVVDKLEKEHPTVLLLCPDWQTAPWFKKVQPMATRSYFFPRGTRLFEDPPGRKGRLGPTRWGTWVFYINPAEDNTKRVRVLQGKEIRETQLKIAVSLSAD